MVLNRRFHRRNEVIMETLLYIIFAFFFGYAIGKIKGQDEIFDEWHKYIEEHTVYNPITTEYELK